MKGAIKILQANGQIVTDLRKWSRSSRSKYFSAAEPFWIQEFKVYEGKNRA